MLAIICLPLLALFVVRVVYFAFAWRDDEGPGPTNRSRMPRILRLGGVAILIVGLAAAAVVYARTEPRPQDDDDIVGYDVIAGESFPVMASQSQAYRAKLLATGGNYDLLTDEAWRWMARRWHGRNLATTLLVLAVGGLVLCFYLARWF